MKKCMPGVFILLLSLCGMSTPFCYAEQIITAAKVAQAPAVDGIGDDGAWRFAETITTHDATAAIDIRLKVVHTGKSVFFLVQYPDPDESRLHKPWVWDKTLSRYKMGPEREDCFVIKWNMDDNPTDLSIRAETSHVADIWFWKAHRTDPAGFADDKIQWLSTKNTARSIALVSRKGTTMYLLRRGDEGQSAYRNNIFIDYKGDMIPQFSPQVPSASRADIRAKGTWSKGVWTIEFSRSLLTGHLDDIQLVSDRKFQLGVSRYEIAGREPDAKLSQPLFGSGDVSENLFLVLAR